MGLKIRTRGTLSLFRLEGGRARTAGNRDATCEGSIHNNGEATFAEERTHIRYLRVVSLVLGPEMEAEKLIVGHGVLARGSVGRDILMITVGMVCCSYQSIVCPL